MACGGKLAGHGIEAFGKDLYLARAVQWQGFVRGTVGQVAGGVRHRRIGDVTDREMSQATGTPTARSTSRMIRSTRPRSPRACLVATFGSAKTKVQLRVVDGSGS